MIYDILSAIIIAFLFLLLLAVIVKFAKAENREEKIKFIRSFKMGKCAIIYVAAIPIFWMGLVFSGDGIFEGFFHAIDNAISLVTLGYDFSKVSQLMERSVVFSIATYFCFVLVLFNAILFVVSLFHQKLWAQKTKALWRSANKDKLLIVGNNKHNHDIYFSDEFRSKIIVDNLSKEDQAKMFVSNVNYLSTQNAFAEISKLIDLTIKAPKITGTVIINTGNDESNLDLCRQIRDRIEKEVKSVPDEMQQEYVTGLFSRISIYVFGSPQYETLYCEVVQSSSGCVHYISKYKQIAIDFINKYPASKFIPNKYINPDTTLKTDANVNISLIGFGKTNQQIFLSSVANNQFMTRDAHGKLVMKQVKYNIFDKEKTKNNKNLNHTYYRFKNEIISKVELDPDYEEKFLSLPKEPAIVSYEQCNVNDPLLYETLKKVFCEKNSTNLVVIAFGSDLENIDLAEKMIEITNEWNVKNLQVFVKVRSANNNFAVFKRKNCFMIGDEQNVVYNIDKITNDKLNKMARARNRIYALESNYFSKAIALKSDNEKTPEQIIKDADHKWFVKLTQLERDSNVYGVLSLRSKLHLLGLDYVDKNDVVNATKISEKDFDEIYSCSEISYYPNHFVDGKKIVKATIDYTDSKRGILALQEHYRWNSYMISRGIIPATRKEIQQEKNKDGSYSNGKNYVLRRHGNITTADGLVEFRKKIAERDNCSESDADVIKYDFQLLDDAFWLLDKQGYAIIKKEIVKEDKEDEKQD